MFALGINQDDLLERASQVQIMSLIYSSASHVTVWLGEEADNSVSAFELLHHAAQGSIQWPPFEEHKTRKDLLISRTASIKNLLLREWFRRIWVSWANDLCLIPIDHLQGSARGRCRPIYLCCMRPECIDRQDISPRTGILGPWIDTLGPQIDGPRSNGATGGC